MPDTAGQPAFSQMPLIADVAPKSPTVAERCAEAARLAMETTPEESLALQAQWLANGGRFNA